MEETRILMVVNEPEARAAYEETLSRVGVAYDTAHGFKEVLRMTVEGAYNGLLVDILTLIRSSKEEKTIAYDCINFFPTLRVKWDSRQKTVSVGPQEQAPPCGDTDSALSHFIDQRCRTFTARSLRRFNRKDSYLSLLLETRRNDMEPRHLKTFTVNISQGGAFVHTTEPAAKGTQLRLTFPEMPGPQPLRASVCWSIPWGGCRSIPGIGVMFDISLSEEQADWLKKIAG